MKKTLLAAGVALAMLGGAATATTASAAGIGIYVGSPGYHHHYRHRGHYWWHNQWYDYQPAGYYYTAPPYAYDHPYWRTHWRESHHRRDWDRRRHY